ncbi:hypothetical protein KMZ32_00655 [Phycicoccus sp. MAQZ13P-2]|uniref:hypothetical protein n=1 Tax=Phycicoccus mangrovi TaxID=2840470 RepID=UPI001C007231|nr:hypothetical protein [Phycicoccus mangrovi]MBT9254200.1 hypothetical protein [Phycicoccus mangrovi]MBT9272578.1 hypothetical protein [Phycicoccus mangrovi]
MLRTLTRVAGALAALAGLALTATGVWFAVALGGSGTAEFTTTPAPGSPVVITPDVLNRVDADVRVSATPSRGASLWMARANPSDASAVIGDGRRVEVSGVSVRDWALTTSARGSGEPAQLGSADLWRQQDDAEGPVTLTVEQADAPESVVIAADGGSVERVTLTVVDKRWFVESVVAVLVGLFLLAAGVVALWPRRSRTAAAVPAVPTRPTPEPTAATPEDAR